ncbi:hypothetical protein SCHPADRAFT_996890 [Schizopora paradoxa]|uniref:F-box domain-containing protein n=1 Tax=Schizopora paradoxa TaxID=27342 RepID=A0A0H2RXB5_9AGAM|nr:hypothetical protein SCHPADRAFT_996890 [Schizopora paradoxa]
MMDEKLISLLEYIGVGKNHSQDREAGEGIFYPSSKIACTLEDIVDLTRTLERINTFISNRPDWYRKCGTTTSISLSHDSLRASEDSKAVERSTLTIHALTRGIEAIRHISSWFETQHTACRENIGKLKLRAGLLRLPEEILSEILAYASQQTNVNEMVNIKNSANALTNLSLVCSHFRNVVWDTPDHWEHISSSMNDEATNAYLCRRGAGNLQINMTMSSFRGGEDLYTFWQTIAQKAHLWNRFALHHRDATVEDAHFLEIWEPGARDVGTPQLSEIVVRYPSFRFLAHFQGTSHIEFNQNDKALHFYSSWETPNLRTMITENIIPIPFSGTTSLTHLQIKLGFYEFYGVINHFFAALSSFLSSCPVLDRLTLTVRHCDMSTDAAHVTRVDVPSLTELTLLFESGASYVASSLFNLINSPGVRTFELECDADSEGRDIAKAAFSHCSSFPKLARLSISLLKPLSRFRPSESNNHLWISIPNLPHLQVLEMSTSGVILKSSTEMPQLPSLQSLSFKNCTSDMEWFKTFCDQIRLQHQYGSPVKLYIEGCWWKSSMQEAYRSMGSPHAIGLDV